MGVVESLGPQAIPPTDQRLERGEAGANGYAGTELGGLPQPAGRSWRSPERGARQAARKLAHDRVRAASILPCPAGLPAAAAVAARHWATGRDSPDPADRSRRRAFMRSSARLAAAPRWPAHLQIADNWSNARDALLGPMANHLRGFTTRFLLSQNPTTLTLRRSIEPRLRVLECAQPSSRTVGYNTPRLTSPILLLLDIEGSPETGVGGFEAGWFGGQKRGG